MRGAKCARGEMWAGRNVLGQNVQKTNYAAKSAMGEMCVRLNVGKPSK
jgi:hypothetical protein